MMRSNIFNTSMPIFSAISYVSMILGAYSAQDLPDHQNVPDQEQQNKFKKDGKNTLGSRDVRKFSQNLSLDELFAGLKVETNTEKAERIEQKIRNLWIQSGSETVDLLMSWSTTAILQKDWASASDLLDQVIVLAPKFAEGWNNRAILHLIHSRYDKSIRDIEQVLKFEPRHFAAMARLGSILQKLGQDKNALIVWKKILELYPTNKEAKKSVAVLEKKLSGQKI